MDTPICTTTLATCIHIIEKSWVWPGINMAIVYEVVLPRVDLYSISGHL